MQKLINQIAQDLANGRNKHEIIKELIDLGMEPTPARQLVTRIEKQINGIRGKKALHGLGATFAILGAGSLVLPFIGIDFFVFNWVYTWGYSTAILIKLSFLIVGVILYFATSDN